VNPWGGFLCLSLVICVAMFVVWLLVRGPNQAQSLAVCCATALVVLSLHRVAFRDTPADRGALQLLSRDWLAPSGIPWRFWSTSGHD
jgi:hypothetical protein